MFMMIVTVVAIVIVLLLLMFVEHRRVPPIHLYDVLEVREVGLEPRLIAEWNEVRDVGSQRLYRGIVQVVVVVVRDDHHVGRR